MTRDRPLHRSIKKKRADAVLILFLDRAMSDRNVFMWEDARWVRDRIYSNPHNRTLWTELVVEALQGSSTDTVENTGSFDGEPSLSYHGGASRYVFRREGKVWSIAYGGETCHLPDSRGLRRIQVLLVNQGEEVPVGQLTDRTHVDRGAPVADKQAMDAYRRRAEELELRCEDSDPANAAEAKEELINLADQIRSATGSENHRTRRMGDDQAKAASASGQSLSRALDSLESAGMKELARHFRESIIGPASKGPAYRPAERVNWEF